MQQFVDILQLEVGSVLSDQLHNHLRWRKLPDNTGFADLVHDLSMTTAMLSACLHAKLYPTLFVKVHAQHSLPCGAQNLGEFYPQSRKWNNTGNSSCSADVL